jgi:PBP1b-binding outer membrane lipoprotein LpoB
MKRTIILFGIILIVMLLFGCINVTDNNKDYELTNDNL